MVTISRDKVIEHLALYKDKPIIKVITGVRRCGKSTVMALYQEYLRSHNVAEEQIISLNFEDMDYAHLLDSLALHSYLRERLLPDKMNYVFLDEVQNVSEFQRAVDSLYLKPNVDIYLTGSNARLLSGELATLLSGRYIALELLPLSFAEYYSAQGKNQSLRAIYNRYITSGSFPYLAVAGATAIEQHEYLQGIYSTIILKDVVQRYKINDIKMLDSIIRFIFDSIGSPLSYKKIADTMASAGRKIDPKTVEKYISALESCFVLYPVSRYDIKGKKYLKLLEKQYVVDISLRRILFGNRSYDSGHILENLVFLELKRRGYEIYVGIVGDREVDFVASGPDEKLYIQVAASVQNEDTLKRELAPLLAIKDSYPKLLLTLDEEPAADYDGIKRMNVLEWFLGQGGK